MTSWLTRVNPVTVNDILEGHMGLEIDCLDRIYLTLSAPNLEFSASRSPEHRSSGVAETPKTADLNPLRRVTVLPDAGNTVAGRSEWDWLFNSTCAPHRRLVSVGTDSTPEGSDEDAVNVMRALHEHHGSMEAVCRSILSNMSDVKDALQQAKENAIKHSPEKPKRGWRV